MTTVETNDEKTARLELELAEAREELEEARASKDTNSSLAQEQALAERTAELERRADELVQRAEEQHAELERVITEMGKLEDLLMDGIEVAEEKVAERREWVGKVKARLAVEGFDNPEEGT